MGRVTNEIIDWFGGYMFIQGQVRCRADYLSAEHQSVEVRYMAVYSSVETLEPVGYMADYWSVETLGKEGYKADIGQLRH